MKLKKLKFKVRKSVFESAFFVIAVLFAFAILLLVVTKAWTGMRPNLEDSINKAVPEGSINVTDNFNKVTTTITIFDKLLPLLIVGLFAFILIITSLYLNNPMMLIVGIIVLAVAIMIGVIYANVYNEISSTSEFSEANSSLPLTELFMKYLPIILTLLIVGIVAIIIFSRQSSGGL